jgi:hypothetical protein
VFVTTFLALTLYSKDDDSKSFCLGVLLPVAVYVFGRTWVIDELLGISVGRNDPFEEGIATPKVLAIIQAIGMGCGILMLRIKLACQYKPG